MAARWGGGARAGRGPPRADLPDPLARGPYTPTTVDPVRAGTVNLQEPAANGNPPSGASAAATVQLRGSLYYPANRASGSPIIVLVHGNHASCARGTAPNCTVFERNDRGYAYLGENLATWGYTVFSIDQDQLIFYQDGTARGMHQRRLIIAATLDALYNANQAAIPDDANNNIGGQLVGKLDFSRIGLMGHSRGGDAVTSFLDFNRTRPEPGRRYDGIRGVIALAPTDYERRAPYGTAFMSYVGYCDGDVSNMMGTRFYERSQYIQPDDPYPRIQALLHGANHNWFNTVWFADGDDSTTSDPACSTNATTNPNNIRLSGGTYTRTTTATPPTDSGTYGSGDPSLMGDQERAGLAVMGSFFRRYVGGDTSFQPYMTGEVSSDGTTPQLPSPACPTVNTRIACFDRLNVSYFAPPAEREDVIRPDTDNPLTVSSLGTAISGHGFSNPYLAGGGINPIPPTTDGGYDWCNPEPTHFTPSAVGETGLPTAAKGCPLPAAGALGGQNGTRENAPVNHSYGLQYALAWDAPAELETDIPQANGDVSKYKALALGAGVNFFDPRNPSRSPDGLWNPAATTQNFKITLTDADGNEGTVLAGNPRYGGALHQTVGNVTARVHVVLNEVRVPLGDFASQGVDLEHVRNLRFDFGGDGTPATGSIELADVRFQELTDGGASDEEAHRIAAAAIDNTPRASAADEPDVQWVATPPAAPSCSAPAATFAKAKRGSGGRLTLTGAATAGSCGDAVRSVRVTVTKPVGGGRCKFLRLNGTLAKKSLPCASPVGLVATGTTNWALKFRAAPKGRYQVSVSALDTAGRQQATVPPTGVTVR